jgi:hypothetical protein
VRLVVGRFLLYIISDLYHWALITV